MGPIRFAWTVNRALITGLVVGIVLGGFVMTKATAAGIPLPVYQTPTARVVVQQIPMTVVVTQPAPVVASNQQQAPSANTQSQGAAPAGPTSPPVPTPTEGPTPTPTPIPTPTATPTPKPTPTPHPLTTAGTVLKNGETWYADGATLQVTVTMSVTFFPCL